MSWFADLLNRIHPQFQKWYDFFDTLEYPEPWKTQIAEWSKKLPVAVSAALLALIKKYYDQYGEELTKEFIEKITDAIDDFFE